MGSTDCPACNKKFQWGDWPCERCKYAPYRTGPFMWVEDGEQKSVKKV